MLYSLFIPDELESLRGSIKQIVARISLLSGCLAPHRLELGRLAQRVRAAQRLVKFIIPQVSVIDSHGVHLRT